MKIFLLIVFIISTVSAHTYNYEKLWSGTLYQGKASRQHFLDILQCNYSDTRSYYILSAALARRIAGYKDWTRFELEGQFATHLEKIYHIELNSLLILRWLKFFWEDYVITTLAFGGGLSYANQISKFEVEDNTHHARLYKYLLWEITLGLPVLPQIEGVFRIHHRSGFMGLMGGWGGTNYYGFGIKYYFNWSKL